MSFLQSLTGGRRRRGRRGSKRQRGGALDANGNEIKEEEVKAGGRRRRSRRGRKSRRSRQSRRH